MEINYKLKVFTEDWIHKIRVQYERQPRYQRPFLYFIATNEKAQPVRSEIERWIAELSQTAWPKLISNLRSPVNFMQTYNELAVGYKLKQLGYERVLCQIWDVDDDEARLLLATLNRLAGQDDPHAKGRLIEQLCKRWDLKQLAKMLPERREQLQAILDLSRPPPAPRPAMPSEQLPQALTFFLPAAEAVRVKSALKTIAIESRWARPGGRPPPGGGSDRNGRSPAGEQPLGDGRSFEGGRPPIDDGKALVLLADFYLYSRKELSVAGQTQ